jgi:hypothetical protein
MAPAKRHGKKTKTFLIRHIKKYFTPKKVQIIGKGILEFMMAD